MKMIVEAVITFVVTGVVIIRILGLRNTQNENYLKNHNLHKFAQKSLVEKFHFSQ